MGINKKLGTCKICKAEVVIKPRQYDYVCLCCENQYPLSDIRGPAGLTFCSPCNKARKKYNYPENIKEMEKKLCQK